MKHIHQRDDTHVHMNVGERIAHPFVHAANVLALSGLHSQQISTVDATVERDSIHVLVASTDKDILGHLVKGENTVAECE